MAIALGVATVVWVTSTCQSVMRAISTQIIDRWIGRSHLSIESSLGHWGAVAESMVADAEALEEVAHVTARLKRRLRVSPVRGGNASNDENDDSDRAGGDGRRGITDYVDVDAIGINASSESRFRSYDIEGSMIKSNSHGTVIIERDVARRLGIGVGDTVQLGDRSGLQTIQLTVIGLYEAQRIAKFQRPTVLLQLGELQSLTGDDGRVTIIDVMFRRTDGNLIERQAERLRTLIKERRLGYQVKTSTAQIRQLTEAQRQTEFAFTAVSSVALLTAFFIVATTMSMGLMERIRQFGLLRCVGVTRGELMGSVLCEVAPLGAVGVLMGVPLGLGLTWGSTIVAPQYVQGIAISWPGMVSAAVGGLATTLAGGFIPAIQAGRVSPLAATRPQSAAGRPIRRLAAAAVGVAMVAVFTVMLHRVDPVDWMRPGTMLAGVSLLYVGFALTTPLIVGLVGQIAGPIVATLLRLRPSLLRDQIGRATWRSAGICCGLMVALSLLVNVFVDAETVRRGWDFPKQIPESFVWTTRPLPRATAEMIRTMPGVAGCSLVSDFLVSLGESRSRFFKMFKIKSTFVAGEPERFLTMTRLEFLEGDADEAKKKLKQGGYILLPPEASRAFDLHVGDKVPITAGARRATFEVAGVVQSPALDIAVTFFQADSYMMIAAANSVLGTLEDARRLFGIDSVSMILLNLDLPNTPPPELFERQAPPKITPRFVGSQLLSWGDRLTCDAERLAAFRPRLERWLAGPSGKLAHHWELFPYVSALQYTADRWADQTPTQRWQMFCDRLIQLEVVNAINRPDAIFGSIRELKQKIDDSIREATLLLATIPIVALFVAAFGAGNLMMANVLNRTREIGILRASGATRSQIVRLVLGEAVILGATGSIAGLSLGLYASYGDRVMLERALGLAPRFELPEWDVAAAIALTLAVCVVAGVLPSLRAARRNVIESVRAT